MAKKKKIKAPGLSARDQWIYIFLILSTLALGFFLPAVIIGKRQSAFFNNDHMLAQGNPGNIVLIFLGIAYGGGFALWLNWLRRKRQPIFGKKNIQYGPPKWKPIYPFVSKQFWRNLFCDKIHLIKTIVCAFVLLIVLISSFFFGPTARECLYDDGSVLVYNAFNENTAKYDKEDVKEIKFWARRYRGRRYSHTRYGIEMEMTMKDGEKFYFTYREFRSKIDGICGSIVGMHQIKICFDECIITTDGEEYLPNVIEDMDLNSKETELLYLLFQ